MGRSWPTFMHEECTFGTDQDGNLIIPINNPSNETSIREYLGFKKQQVQTCWTCKDCDFNFNAVRKSDGAIIPVHFLECKSKCIIFHIFVCRLGLALESFANTCSYTSYLDKDAGTRQLAEDLVRFMQAIDAPKLSLYGGSYGTRVMGTFATLFPHYVDKFVLDSPG